MNLQRLYIDSPRLVKNIAGRVLNFLPRNMLFGKKYRNVRKEIGEFQFAQKEKIENIRFAKLKEILEYSYKSVPYYRKLFDLHGINVSRILTHEDFTHIPLLDKKTIARNFDSLQATSFKPIKKSYVTTGGTSGQTLRFVIDKERSSIEWAFLTMMWERFGYTINDRRVMLRGEIIKKKRGELWLFDPLLNQVSLSTFHMTNENLMTYHQLIEDFKPHVIHGYPSAIIRYAQFLRNKKIVPTFKLKGVVCISENIIPAQRRYIEETFSTRFFSFYGHSEKLILAGECEQSSFYHIEPLYGYTEILRADGTQVTEDGEVGELVGTGFINRAMPFIRYRTGDIVEYTTERCKCGRNFTLIKSVKGRWLQEMLVTKNMSLISITALNVHSDIFDRVERFQFVQSEPGKTVLEIVPREDYQKRDSLRILGELSAKLDRQIDLTLKLVSKIPTTDSGKSLFLKQHIDISKYFPV